MLHFKCRNTKYPFSEIQRFPVSDDQVSWSIQFENYQPVEYTSPVLINKPWADLNVSDNNFKPRWNALDGLINRKSHEGEYALQNGRPLNIRGRTGISGRGTLGRWGPNHAADPIVTRWKMDDGVKILHHKTNLPILQFCAIQRRDNNEWAIPGGMVDPGETVTATLKREFQEEALNSLEANAEQLEKDRNLVADFFKEGTEVYRADFFKEGTEVYRGYVDDPRNTDNAWMETVAYNFHDDTNSSVGKFALQAGDDAKSVQWMDVDENLALYASHINFIKIVVKLRNCHW
ncbi:NUDIX domain [Popillia japonica]|uniref:NUDIX domain n=1 Tax=Popillia japonica TaxID=7064 RepID=A0AAW1N3T5_POPJA